MKKPYTWIEIKNVLLEKLDNSKHILTYGTIGSCDVNKDIDTIITKKPSSSASDFFKEIHELFDYVNNYLVNNYDSRLIRTNEFNSQEEIKFIAKFNEKDLDFQVMTYTSYKQIDLHWAKTGLKQSEIKNLLINEYDCLFGDEKSLFEPDFKEYKHENLFLYMNDCDRINSNCPHEFLILNIKSLSRYISKRLKKQIKLKDDKNIRDSFYEICDLIDSS